MIKFAEELAVIRKCERVTRISGPGPQLGAIPRDNNKAFSKIEGTMFFIV